MQVRWALGLGQRLALALEPGQGHAQGRLQAARRQSGQGACWSPAWVHAAGEDGVLQALQCPLQAQDKPTVITNTEMPPHPAQGRTDQDHLGSSTCPTD